MIVENGFIYQFMFKYDEVLFDREWYSINFSRNTDLDLILTICMYLYSSNYMASYLLHLLLTLLLYIAMII